MRPQTLIERIEALAPPGFQAGWDKSGLQAAGEREKIATLAVTLDPLPRTVAEALAAGADFLLSHHPLSLSPRLPTERDDYRETLKLLLCSGVWHYAAHTSLDVQTSGPMSWLADELGLTGRAPVEPLASDRGLGFGLVGDLPAPLAPEALVERLSALLASARPALRGVGPVPATIRRVAYCPGSGGSMAPKAFAAGADVYLTGDVGYHYALAAERLGFVIDCGHFGLEEEMMRRFARTLGEQLAGEGLAVTFIPGHDPLRSVSPGFLIS